MFMFTYCIVKKSFNRVYTFPIPQMCVIFGMGYWVILELDGLDKCVF